MAGSERKSFNEPDEVRTFDKAQGDIVRIGGGEVARMVLAPGWRWSESLKPTTGTEWCLAPHFQYVVSGQLHVVMSNGEEFDSVAGDVAVVPPGHDAWVVGDEPAVLIDWGGAHEWGSPA